MRNTNIKTKYYYYLSQAPKQKKGEKKDSIPPKGPKQDTTSHTYNYKNKPQKRKKQISETVEKCKVVEATRVIPAIHCLTRA